MLLNLVGLDCIAFMTLVLMVSLACLAAGSNHCKAWVLARGSESSFECDGVCDRSPLGYVLISYQWPIDPLIVSLVFNRPLLVLITIVR